MVAATENDWHHQQTSSSMSNPPSVLIDNHDISDVPQARKVSTPAKAPGGGDAAWGSNFWVTLVDPQV